jgi:hypothetical protein
MQKIITRFQQLDLPNYTTEELSVELNTPINIIQKSLDDLQAHFPVKMQV